MCARVYTHACIHMHAHMCSTHMHTRMLMNTFSHPILQSSLCKLVYQLFKKKNLCCWGKLLFSELFLIHCFTLLPRHIWSMVSMCDQSLRSLPDPGSKEPLLDVHESLELYIFSMMWALVREHEVWNALRVSWHSNIVWKRGLQLTLKTFLVNQTIRRTTDTTQMDIFSKPNYVRDERKRSDQHILLEPSRYNRENGSVSWKLPR